MLSHFPLAVALLFAPEHQVGNVRVVDAQTSQPIAGATVFGVQEADAPIWGSFWFRVSAMTDEDGWADLPLSTDDAPYLWRIVRAEGYAVSGSMQVPRPGVDPETVTLQRALPAEIRIVDHLGRPAPLVHLGFSVGCGHTPDVASAVTDRDGRATLWCIGAGDRDIADIYPVGDGVRTDYLWVNWEDALSGGYEAIVLPGATLEGRVFRPNGSPAAGYSVGIPEIHRGPWARTDADGFFRLMGLEPGAVSYVHVKDRSGETVSSFEGSRIGVERILRLPAETWGDTDRDVKGSLSITITVAGTGVDHSQVWPHGVPGEIWDPATGWTHSLSLRVDQTEVVELPSGSFEMELGGGDSPYDRRHVGRIQITAGATPVALVVELPPIHVARLEVSGIDLESRVKMIAANGVWSNVTFDSIELHAGQATGIGVVESFAVPSEPFGLWLATEERGRGHIFLEMSGLGDESASGRSPVRARPRAR